MPHTDRPLTFDHRKFCRKLDAMASVMKSMQRRIAQVRLREERKMSRAGGAQ